MPQRPLLAIFVGGKSRRMGRPKGLLSVRPGGDPIVAAQVREGRRAGLDVAFVGNATPYGAVAPDVPRIDDDPQGVGPLGGLRAVMLHASDRGHAEVICVACDMPHLSQRVLEQVVAAKDDGDAAVVAPRRAPQAPWEPMLARYEVARVRPVLDTALAEGVRSFQGLFARLRIAPIPHTSVLEKALADWDTPDDVPT